jgi:hypothetical protein
MKPEKTYQIILMTITGMLGSVLIGFILYNTSIFNVHRSSFQFVACGFYGSLFFSLLEYESGKVQLGACIAMLFLNLVLFTGKSLSAPYIVRDFFNLGGLFLLLKLYFLFIKRYPDVRYYLRSLALACIYGLMDVLIVSLVYLINEKVYSPPLYVIYMVGRYGIYIGLGIGLGLDFYYQNRVRLSTLLKIKPI